MPRGLNATNPALVAAFKSALLAQGTVVMLIFVVLAIAWVACREILLAQVRARLATLRRALPAEPVARRVLRIGFGVLWILDGLLQAQPEMPGGLPNHILAPAAAGSPGWVVHLVDWAGVAWAHDPMQAATGVVWIQLGIGIWLLSASRGRWSRLAGLVSLGWGAVIWGFGEAFGSMLGPGVSWLMGAPGAALFYCAAGALLAMPARFWQHERLGKRVLQGSGALLIGFAVLQAWPGRGFWQGSLHGQAGPLASAVNSMATVRQPAALSHAVSWFGSFAGGHGFAVNLTAVVVPAALGACLLTGRLAIVRPAVIAAIAFCLADWVLIQDLGFLGGLGTDPNSMLPQALILGCGLLALSAGSHAAAAADAETAEPASTSAPSASGAVRGWLQPGELAHGLSLALGTASTSAVLSLWAAAMVLMGAAPMALATANRDADPIIAAPSRVVPARVLSARPGWRADHVSCMVIDDTGRCSETAASDSGAERRLPSGPRPDRPGRSRLGPIQRG